MAACVGATVFDPINRPITARHDYALPLRTPEGLLVEIHRYFCERPLFRPDYEGATGIFGRARVGDDGLMVPDLVDLFLGLAIHATHHAYHLPLRSVLDGVLLGARPEVDLAEVAARAERWRATRATAGFLLVLQNFGFDRPDLRPALRRLAAPAKLSALLAQAPWPERETHDHEWRRRLRVARLLDTPTARVGYFAQRVALRGADALWNRTHALRRRA